MLHPDIRFNINAFIFFDIHCYRDERAGNDILSTLWEFQACPLLPFHASAAYGQDFVTGFGDPCPCPHVDSQPGVDGQAAVRFPRDVIVNAGERSVFMMFFP